jgi:hypothetical protein
MGYSKQGSAGVDRDGVANGFEQRTIQSVVAVREALR